MEASSTRRSGFTLGQLLGAWSLLLIALLGVVLGSVVYVIERSQNEDRAAVRLNLSLALLRHELDAHVRPGRQLATLVRDLLVEQTDAAAALYLLNDFGPRLLRQAPIVEGITVLHKNGAGWQAQRSGGRIWTREWPQDLDDATLPWENGDAPVSTGAAPDAQLQDYRSHGAYRGAVSTSRERGDDNRGGAPRLFWHTPTTQNGEARITAAVSFRGDSGMITVLLNLNWTGIHRWTSRIYDGHAVRYLVVDSEHILLGAPADYQRFHVDPDAPGLPDLEAVSDHSLIQGLQFWRTQETPLDQAFVWESPATDTWLQRFQRYEISAERTLLMGTAFDLSAASLRENALLYWVGVVSFGGAGLGLLGSLFLAWRIRRPLEAVIREGRRVDAFEAKRAFWPKTWIAEPREVTQLFMGLREQVQQILKDAQALQTSEANEKPKQSKAAIRPPDAFLQAMAATRRELRRAKEQVENDRHVLKGLRGEHLALCERLENQCHALAALVAEARRPGEEAFPARVAGVVQRYTGIEGVSIWLAPESGADLERRAFAGPALPVEKTANLPVQMISELLFSATATPAISLCNCFNDVRSAGVAKHWTHEDCPNLLFTAIPPQDGDWGILCFHRAGDIPWDSDWQCFALALAGLLATSLGARQFAEAPTNIPLAVEEDYVFRDVAEHAPGVLILLDESHNIRYLNEAGRDFYGDVALGRPYRDQVAETMRDAEIKTVKERQRGYDGPPFLSAHLRQDGMSVSLWVSMAPLQDEYGDSNGLVVWAMEAKS